jgi:LacI family transcriptional regulator
MVSPMRSAPVTIDDVAAAAGVSIRTVSRVLNHSPLVGAATRERIEAAIAQLGFRPSARARGLATGRSYLVGMVHNDRNALVLDSLQRGVAAACTARGYEMIVHFLAPATDDEQMIAGILDFVARSRVDGLILPAPVSGIKGLPEALGEAEVPAFALSAVPVTGFAGVMVSDERGAAADVARHLLSLGHRHIAMVGGPATHSAQERRAGFVAALGEAGVTLLREETGDYGFASGVEAGERLLALRPAPTAIFAANDVMAAGVLKAAAARGVAVPAGLSVVGFDGSILVRMMTPALTSIHRPLEQMARQATTRLIERIEHGGDPETHRVTLTLVPAESTAAV